MHTFHQQVVAAHLGQSFTGCATTYGNIFPYAVVVAHHASCLFAIELEVLGFGADTCTWEELIIVADACTSMYGHIAYEMVAIAYHRILVYIAEWSDDVVVAELCLGMHKGH